MNLAKKLATLFGLLIAPLVFVTAATQIDLASAVRNVLPTANGGTGNTNGTATNVSGVVAEANGGTGSNNTPGSAGHVLRSNGTHYVDSAIQSADIPNNAANTTGTAAGLSVVLVESSGGTGANNTVGAAGHVLRSNGTHYVDSAIQAADVPTAPIAETVGTAIGSSSTIAPVSPITHITGTNQINTITAPAAFAVSGLGGCLNLVADGAWTMGTSGNIAIGTTAIVNQQMTLCYDNATSKWYPLNVPTTTTLYGTPVSTKALNYVTAGGVNNAITASLSDANGTNIPLVAGLCLNINLGALTLQAGANTLAYNGGGAVQLRSHFTGGNLGTAYTGASATPIIQLCYNGTVWLDMSE